MSSESDGKTSPFEGIEDWLKGIIREEVRAAANSNGHYDGDRLLNAKEAAKVLAVSTDWLYRNAHSLPFVKRLPPSTVRFSYHGIQKYIAMKGNN